MYSQIMYFLYTLLANIFAFYIYADYHFNVILDKYSTDEELHVKNRYFDHIVGKYISLDILIVS